MARRRPQEIRIDRRPRRRSGGRAVLAVVALLAIALAVAAVTGWYLLFKPDRSVAAGRSVEIVIKKGSSTTGIAKTLSDAGVVRNALMFRIEARRAHLDSRLRPGTYAMKTGMPDGVVLSLLRKGPNIVYYDVPIPEGFTIEQIAARFAARTGVSEEEFLALAKTGAPQFAAKHPYLQGVYHGSLQGYLFPKTYRIKAGTKPEQIIEKMLQQFDAEVKALDLSYAQSQGLDLHEVVTLASIIEREVRLDKEYPLVSSVIYNRLDANMRLQLDSTVFYFLPPGTKVITKANLADQNPYNTYQHKGLPPGPLANPGMQALDAAAHPAKTKYYYYVLTSKDGSQTFTTNYKDFLKAVDKYHKVFDK